MILNIILVLILGALIGSTAHNIMGGTGGIFHNAFVGIVGILVAHTLARIVGVSPYGVAKNLLLDIIGACIFLLVVNAIRKSARKR